MKQVENFVVIVILGILITACNQKHTIEGNISGLGNDTILVEYAPVAGFYRIDEPYTDTIFASNGEFVYNIPTNEPTLLFMFPKKGEFKRKGGHFYRPMQKYMILLAKPEDRIKISGQVKEYYLEYVAVGTTFNEQYSQVRKSYIEQTSEAAKIELQIDTLNPKKENAELRNELFRKRNEVFDIAKAAQLEYIKNNWDKELSAYFLTRQRLDTLAKYYDYLDAGLKEGIFKEMLENQYLRYQKYTKTKEAEQNIVEGKVAPDFKLKSLDGTDISLNSVNSQYVVIDFWGSWCGWCIKGFPKMKEYYKKYKNEIEIIGIACNDTEEKWRKSIQENELPWLQVINDEDIQKDVAVTYGIKGYPTKFILDKEKKIVAKFIGETDDFYKKLDELIEK